MDIIAPVDLAAYLDIDAPEGESFAARVGWANDLVAEFAYPGQTATPSPLPSRVRLVALEVAARSIRNPEGYSSETVDDYTWRRPESTRDAGIYLTDSEKADLLDAVGRVVSHAPLTMRVRSAADVLP